MRWPLAGKVVLVTAAARIARSTALGSVVSKSISLAHSVSATVPQVTRARGYYLLVSSAAAFTALPGMAAYCAAKAGVEQFGNALRLELAHKGVTLRASLRQMPWPLGGSMPTTACAQAFVDGIERRRRRVYVPRAIAGVQAMRTLFTGPAAEAVLRRRARTLVPELEREVARLGRPFGRNSVAAAEWTTPARDDR